MTAPSSPNVAPPGRSGSALASPAGTLVLAAIVAIVASVITTVVVGGGRQTASGPTPTQASSGGANGHPGAHLDARSHTHRQAPGDGHAHQRGHTHEHARADAPAVRDPATDGDGGRTG
jgi:hypothetical protein